MFGEKFSGLANQLREAQMAVIQVYLDLVREHLKYLNWEIDDPDGDATTFSTSRDAYDIEFKLSWEDPEEFDLRLKFDVHFRLIPHEGEGNHFDHLTWTTNELTPENAVKFGNRISVYSTVLHIISVPDKQFI